MGADGESPRKLLQAAPGDRFLQVQWSPKGERIAYIKTSQKRPSKPCRWRAGLARGFSTFQGWGVSAGPLTAASSTPLKNRRRTRTT